MTLKNYINGRFAPAKDSSVRAYLNPADNSEIGVAAESSTADMEAAILAARKAFDEGPWPCTPPQERAAKLFKLAALIDSRAAQLAELETRNNGKPLREAQFDVADAANCFRYYAGLATKPHGQTFEVGDPNIVWMRWASRQVSCSWSMEPVAQWANISPPARW